jgi:hypothetical protein
MPQPGRSPPAAAPSAAMAINMPKSFIAFFLFSTLSFTRDTRTFRAPSPLYRGVIVEGERQWSGNVPWSDFKLQARPRAAPSRASARRSRSWGCPRSYRQIFSTGDGVTEGRRPPNRLTKPLNQKMVLGNSSLQLIRSAGWRANHIEETIRSIARLYAEHHQNATPLQRAVDRITALLGRPRFIGVLTVIAAGWISLNLLTAACSVAPT